MPPSKPKPSEMAMEAKKTYIPFIRHNYSSQWSPTSFLCPSESMVATSQSQNYVCRFAFYERDPIDLALDWATGGKPVPVIMPANEKRPGGDWEAGVMSPEECLCRRSNLFATLTTSAQGSYVQSNYPIPPKSGIYSEKVVVFRDGPDRYEAWQQYRTVPIISVCPVKRPKLDSTGKRYSFKQERELMCDKIRTALRIAIYYDYESLCIGTFGLGPGFGNPVEEVAIMWRDAILEDEEFKGRFHNVVFAFEAPEGPHGSWSNKASSSRSSSASSSPISADLDVFKYIFSPSVVHGLS